MQPQQKQRLTLQERFDAFDKKHPDIYATFKNYALRIRQNRQHYSARLILTGISFNSALDGRDSAEKYKINNDFTSRYSRKLLDEMPEKFAGFFEKRQLKAE